VLEVLGGKGIEEGALGERFVGVEVLGKGSVAVEREVCWEAVETVETGEGVSFSEGWDRL
jgi:hypothetical protein